MPHKTSVAQVWDSRRGKAVRLAYRRLLISLPSFLLSVGIRQFVTDSNTTVAWAAWFASAAFAMLACIFAAEAAFGVRGSEKSDDASFVAAISRAVMWFTIFWIGYLAFIVFYKIAFLSG
jgi:hypothetical protein